MSIDLCKDCGCHVDTDEGCYYEEWQEDGCDVCLCDECYGERIEEMNKKPTSLELLEEAAINYGNCYGAGSQACSAGLPHSFTQKLDDIEADAKQMLLEAALAHWNNQFDGATE